VPVVAQPVTSPPVVVKAPVIGVVSYKLEQNNLEQNIQMLETLLKNLKGLIEKPVSEKVTPVVAEKVKWSDM